MDEVQEAFYRLLFREAFLEKKGTEFQDWFVRLAGYAFGSDFEAVRPYGKHGDFKCDGRRLSTGTIFQCYGPYQHTAALLEKKIADDFRGAREHWDTWMNEWVLVHNDTRGLPASSIRLIDDLRNEHPHVTINMWIEPKLQELAAAEPGRCCCGQPATSPRGASCDRCRERSRHYRRRYRAKVRARGSISRTA